MTLDTDPERASGRHTDLGVERPSSPSSDSTGAEKRAGQDAHAETTDTSQDGHVVTEPLKGEPSVAADLTSCHPTQSRASSRRSRRPVPVPRSERRGLFASLAIVPEVESPYDYKNSTKWGITLTVALATAAAPLGSTIFYREQELIQVLLVAGLC